jgi:hypothetical protein
MKHTLKKSPSKTKPLSGEALLEIFPAIPDYIYACIDNKHTEDKTIQANVAVEALLLNKDPETLHTLIPTWAKDTDLPSKFEYRSPTEEEWYALHYYHLANPTFIELIKRYPTTFKLSELTSRNAHLLVLVTDWASWNERHKHITVSDYLNCMDTFNAVEQNPLLANYKKAFLGDITAVRLLSSQPHSKDKPDRWYDHNPYLKTEQEEHTWNALLTPYVKHSESTIRDLARLNLIEPKYIKPEALTASYSDSDGEICIKLMHKDLDFRARVLAYLFKLPINTYSGERQHLPLTRDNQAFTILTECIAQTWLSKEQCITLLEHCYSKKLSTLISHIDITYPGLLNSVFPWPMDSNQLNTLIAALTPERFLGLNPKVAHLLEYYSVRQEPKIFTALTLQSIDGTTLSYNNLMCVLENHIPAKVPYAHIDQLSKSDRYNRINLALWKAWFAYMKPQLSERDYKAILMYLVRTNPNADVLAGRYKKLAQRVKTVVI